eukprot:GHVU01170483.1.p1 GENE.GHVU01170483.1~~GHVU01170483.1.p1  ORF type:complete len:125 (-),score=2.53 GHVU01170483.1:63-437(-)
MWRDMVDPRVNSDFMGRKTPCEHIRQQTGLITLFIYMKCTGGLNDGRRDSPRDCLVSLVEDQSDLIPVVWELLLLRHCLSLSLFLRSLILPGLQLHPGYLLSLTHFVTVGIRIYFCGLASRWLG